MKRFKLTKKEKELEESINRGEWRSVMTPELKKHYEEIARYSIKLRKSKAKKEKELPYKTPII